jgi:hypothetical protein
MFRLYKSPNGQLEQVPVNGAEQDTSPPNIEDAFPNPLEAKGENRNEAPFVEQRRNQFELIKKNETEQAKFQTKKLQNSNYQIVNFEITPTASTASQAYYFADFNLLTTVGTAMDAGVLFGTNTADVTKAKYYNLVYMNVRFAQDNQSTSDFIVSPSYVEFYPMQKLTSGDFGGKIPTQVETLANSTGVQAISKTGTQYGVQSFGVDVYGENAYYTQSPDLKGIRCCGVALKRISLSMATAIGIDGIRLAVELGLDINTEGNNY